MSRGLSLFHPEHGVRDAPRWTPDTRFGAWFQRSATWKQYVVEYALAEFERMFGDRPRQFATVLDAGCGAGQAFERPLGGDVVRPSRRQGEDRAC